MLSLTPIQAPSTIPFQRIVVDPTPGTVPISNVVADILGTGKLDVVTGHENNLGGGGLFWYEHPASGKLTDPWIKHTIDANASTYEAQYPFDVNGDGAVDIITSYFNQTVWYENPRGHGGDPRTDLWVRHDIGNFSSHELYVTDLNGDGKPDIATNFALYFQNSPTDWTTVAAPHFDHTVKGIAMFDSGSGLGAVDIVGTGNSRDNITWWENPRDHGGNAVTDQWIPHFISNAYVPTGSQVSDPGLGVSYTGMDMNGDGRMDIVTCGGEATKPYPAGGLMWWEAPADRINGAWIPHTIDANVELVHNLLARDMNGDGSLDLLVFEQDQSDQQRLMIVYNEGGTGQNFLAQTLATSGGHNEWTGDINGDGALDFVNSRHGNPSGINPIEIWINGLAQTGGLAPAISQPPQSHAVEAGSATTFGVIATAGLPIAYQWQLNGADIPGATQAAYTTAATSIADNGGIYRCIVSDAAGFTNSLAATLTVVTTPPPPIDSTPPAATLSGPPPLNPIATNPYEFTVTYSDDVAIDTGTLANSNFTVEGPGGYSQSTTLVSTQLISGPNVTAVYSIPAPTTDGTYSVNVDGNLVRDVSGNAVPAGSIGSFAVQTVPPPPPSSNAPDLGVTLLGNQRASAIGGSAGIQRIRISNVGQAIAQGSIAISLYASTDGTLSTANAIITPTKGGSLNLNLKPGKAIATTLRFNYPSDLVSGSYKIGVWIDSSHAIEESDDSNNTVSGSAVTIAAPITALSAAFSSTLPATVSRAPGATVAVSAANVGNVGTAGKLTVELYQSGDGIFDSSDIPVGTLTRAHQSLRAGGKGIYRLKARSSVAAAGTGYLIAVVNLTGDGYVGTEIVVSPSTIVFQ